MGHIAHLRKQFKSINTHDYIITLIKRRKKNIIKLMIIIGSSFEETWIPIIQGCLCQDWLKLAQWFLWRGFFNFVNVFSLFRNYLPLEKGGDLHLCKLESPCLYPRVWLKLAQWIWRRRFLNFINVFFANYLPLEEGEALHLNKLESTSPKDDLC